MSAGAGLWTLCIDFGTAYSKAAAAPADAHRRFEPGEVRPLAIGAREEGANPFLLESAVFVDDDRVLFGPAAIARAESLAPRKRSALKSFKTLLSVSDLDRALNTAAPASIDPHRMFVMRDLVVFYLAYLLEAIDHAIDEDDVLKSVSWVRRYAAPAWRSGDSAGLHDVVVRLFGEADALREVLGEQLRPNKGVLLKAAPGALAAARARPRDMDMDLVFEATAAAAYTSIGLPNAAAHLIVVDVGAGTTDIAALARQGATLFEIPEARLTLQQAGDFLDRVIANRVLEAAPWARSQAHQTALWNAVFRNIRDVKENVLLDGKAMLRFEGRTITIARRDIERDEDFRAFTKVLVGAYDESLAIVAEDARVAGAVAIDAVAVGGGSAAPFVQDLLRRRPAKAGKLTINARPATPDWAHARAFRGNLAPVFPQLAIAIGGALAPETMLAGSNSVARDRSDSPRARG
jgi:molecular chaperone DnaK